MKHLHQVGLIEGTFISASFAASVSTADTPFPSTYKAPSHAPTLIKNTTVLTGTGERLEAASLYFVKGAGTAVACSMDYDLALQAMTTTPAEVFDSKSRALAAGNSADLVVWSGDPLEVTSYATAVVIEGELTSMESRQSKLLERYLLEDAGMGRAYINR